MNPPAKRQKVVALKYSPGSPEAPKIVGQGVGMGADRIVEMARELGIPLYEDPELVEILSKIQVGAEIQPELYQAVAEVLIFIYKMNQKKMNQVRQQQSVLNQSAARR